ncbi:Oligopeptide transport ATP-binding protein OppD [Planctomycetes bacterium Pan216]|uniref:Oligopeptide transport ATP-binding protein OppD n=1 Tax=Kolteria novifilia TaxID=2527975 RepID=A0A518B7K2_9BACT|nr:Oligopeptide transport ATP-binding protein OppD [Planctomycetes bacterium Pan216]
MTDAISPEATDEPKTATEPVLSVRDLHTHFRVEGGIAKAVEGVSFDLFPGEVLGIVGESGSGKSVASLSIMRLVPDPPGLIAKGEILLRGRDLLKIPYEKMRKVRGGEIGMIFQEPMTALNPVFTIGMQLTEAVRVHEKVSRAEARDRAIEAMRQVGIPDPAERLKDYPHQFSGGMRQRVMIAMALICNPSILIADEPTTALDVTIQAQILELMLAMKEKKAGSSIILITHDLAVVAETCDRVVVMYGGKIQEVGTVHQIFEEPKHPYTRGLLASLPTASTERKSRLSTIPGNVPSIMNPAPGCRFSNRCPEAIDRCSVEEPVLHQLPGERFSRCHLVEEEALGQVDKEKADV